MSTPRPRKRTAHNLAQTKAWMEERKFYEGLKSLIDQYTYEAIGKRHFRTYNAVWARLNQFHVEPMSPQEVIDYIQTHHIGENDESRHRKPPL